MRTFCITTPSSRKGLDSLERFRLQGVEAKLFYGIHATVSGLLTVHPYEVDAPGSGYRMGPKPVGCWIAHRMLWAALTLFDDDHFLVLEDDAVLCPDWQERFPEALADVPRDFDLLYTGNCCVAGTNPPLVKGRVHSVTHCLCTHSYVVARKALQTLIQRCERCWAPVDIAMQFEAFPHLKVFAVLPRIAEQIDTSIPL